MKLSLAFVLLMLTANISHGFSFKDMKNFAEKHQVKSKIVSAAGIVKEKYAAHQSSSNVSQQNSGTVEGTGRVSYVYDGDTYKITADDGSTLKSLESAGLAKSKYLYNNENAFRVRLANVNTEESVHRDKDKNTAKGRSVSNEMKAELSGEQVSFQCFEAGYYGRPVCSIQTSSYDVGEFLISKGYSPYVTKYFKHPTRHNAYTKAAR